MYDETILCITPYQDGKFGTFNHQRHHPWQHAAEQNISLASNNGGISGILRNGPPGHGGFSSDTFVAAAALLKVPGLVKVTWFARYNQWQIYDHIREEFDSTVLRRQEFGQYSKLGMVKFITALL